MLLAPRAASPSEGAAPTLKVDRGTQTLAHVNIPLFLPSGHAQAGSLPCQEAPSLFTVSPSKHAKVRHGLH